MSQAVDLRAPGAPRRYRSLPLPSVLRLGVERFRNAPPALAVRAVIGLRRFLHRLADALTPADLVVFERSTGLAETALLGAVARHDLVDLLEERGPLDAAAIAVARGLDADAVHRTLRALAAMGVFVMHDDGRFSNNRISRALRSGTVERSREWALYFSSGSNATAWLDLARTLETGESAFKRVHGMNVWEWFDAHPDEREMFAHCMMGISALHAPAIASLYPFEEVKRLCDVGGGRGTLLGEILLRHPHIQGVLCDGAGVVESARELLTARGVADRVELRPGSFFEEVPSGCDAYLLKNVLHDWDDATCKQILRVVRAAMTPGQRLIVCEIVVDRLSRESQGTRVDLQMMIACDQGRERSADEIRALLSECGFRFTRAFPYPIVSVFEAEAT
ncbi:MAG: methyltransferase [Polyangiaceae bacterium]